MVFSEGTQQSMVSVNDETITLSDQDTTLLKELINDIIMRFHDAETKEEKIDILEKLPVVLDRYGLLPDSMSVEEAQELIVSGYLDMISSDNL